MQADYRDMSGPSFRFRLERVRALRERTEEAAKQALAAALDEHHRHEKRLQLAEERVAQARDAQLQATGTPSRAAELVARQAYLERAEGVVAVRRSQLARQEHELERRRTALIEAAREREALERLKERRRADHERELGRRDRLVLDEIALARFVRRTA